MHASGLDEITAKEFAFADRRGKHVQYLVLTTGTARGGISLLGGKCTLSKSILKII